MPISLFYYLKSCQEKRDKTCLVGWAWWHMPRLLTFQAQSIGDILGFYSLCLFCFVPETVALSILHFIIAHFFS